MKHTIILVCTVFLSFVLYRIAGSTYDLEITAVLFIVYFGSRRFFPKKDLGSGLTSHHLLDSTVFTLMILNLVLSSGGLYSPLFFLIYFLLFSIALILEPVVALTTALGIMALFIGDITSARFSSLVPLISLPFIVPFAVVIGSEYRKVHKQRIKIRDLQKKEQSVETDALMFISTVVRGHLRSIQDLVNNFHGDHELSKIKSTVRRLQKLIDKFEDSY